MNALDDLESVTAKTIEAKINELKESLYDIGEFCPVCMLLNIFPIHSAKRESALGNKHTDVFFRQAKVRNRF